MSTSLHPQSQVEAQCPYPPAASGGISLSNTPSNVVTPSKRPVDDDDDDDDDDIQFISSKPVKRLKIGDQKHGTPVSQQQLLTSMPAVPTAAVATPIITDARDADRRVSTGMVGLPSDFNAMELTCALRGVSLPVLENFALDQPFRRPRPISPPELSPKQLPQTISPAMLNIYASHSEPGMFGFQATPNQSMTRLSVKGSPSEVERPPQGSPKPSGEANHLQVLNTPINQSKSPPQVSTETGKNSDPISSAMPPPPLPRAEVSMPHDSARNSPAAPENHSHNVTRPNMPKHPCQVCTRMRHQANLARAQGLPMMNSNMLPNMMPQMPCHQQYGQHIHPQMIPMGPNGMHAFGPGFAPIMMPVHGNNLAAMRPHMPPPTQQMVHQNPSASSQHPSRSSEEAATYVASTADSAAPKPGASLSPVRPPASLIQPTYRKHSPNLIVDVAETCQEKFPFEEVAKRHDVPVEKVFDVFAAIIKVPLLRCPTDRRRTGKLASSRFKEYTKAKKDIQEARSQGGAGNKEEIVVSPLDVAQRMGQVEFPQGFSL